MAKVFAIPSYFIAEAPGEALVYKRFNKAIRPVPLYGLEALVKVRDSLDPRHREAFDRSLNWPLRAVVDDQPGAAGVILPLLEDGWFVDLRLSSGAIKRKCTEGQFLLMDKEYCTKVGIPFLTSDQRIMICRSLVYAMGLLHRAEVVYGDLSARNFLYRISPRPQVLLVDCDAVRVHGAAAALGAQPHTPEWEPPEALLAKRRRDPGGFGIQNKQTDRYKLGLAILRIMTPGRGSSVNRDPALARGRLPHHLYELLVSGLSDDPSERPEAKTWFKEFAR